MDTGDGAAEVKPPLPKSLLLRLALGPRAAVLGPLAAGMAPEAEEERERVVRGLGCRAVGPVAWLLGCSRAVDGLHCKAHVQQGNAANNISKTCGSCVTYLAHACK